MSVVGPLLFSIVGGERAAGPLVAVMELLADNNSVIMTVVLLLLGAELLDDGLAVLRAPAQSEMTP